VAGIVRQDPAMSSKVLQIVNSSLFSSGAAVSDVRAAVLRLGMKTIRNLALGIGAFDSIGKTSAQSKSSIDELQKRSLAIAQLSSRIAQGREDTDAAFMAGLVCDVGQLILASTPPLEGGQTQTDAITHAEVGAFLLGLWGLPFRIVEAVANHHAPLRNAHNRLSLPQIVWLASCLVYGEEPDPEYLKRIGADELLPKFKGMMA
jgi:HD-like signal output (HDOD) protein